jgi:predicted nuclease of restriction endonuclease-like (RecB) superfamily
MHVLTVIVFIMDTNANKPYDSLVKTIAETYSRGRVNSFKAVNTILVNTYWHIGQHIVEFEQTGESKAQYGDTVLRRLSKDISLSFGKGFSLSNLYTIRLFFLKYPIFQTVSGILGADEKSAEVQHQFIIDNQEITKGAMVSRFLTWSHYIELLKIDNDLERGFYEKQAMLDNWSVRELQRQKQTALFLRLASGKDKSEILQLARQGRLIEKPEDILKDTYVFEFLKIPEPYHISETGLEERLISQLQEFLLELGKGFAFVGRQYRITLANRHHYIDLVFYHRILKCFVLIDLKIDEAGYEAVGQMNMYLGYMEAEQNTTGDNPPIGIILARSKDELQIKYAMSHTSSQLFVKKYQLYLPNEEELRREIELIYRQQKNEENK